MSSELLDFKSQKNFEFFKMCSLAKRDQKECLQNDCQKVLEYAHATVKDMCLLAAQLYELKEKEEWGFVINPETGLAYWNYNFDDFCAYAFGFSKTKTSNLLRISQFVNLHGENRGEIEAGYADYNTSQLVELAAVPPSHRVYFSPDMSVSDMRIAKDYVKNSAEFLEEKKKVGFDLLTKAQEWRDQGKKSTSAVEILDGQVTLTEIEDLTENEDDRSGEIEYGESLSNPTSDFDEVGEEVDQSDQIASMSDEEGFENEDTPSGDEYDEADEAYEDMQKDMQTIEEDSEKSIVVAEVDQSDQSGEIEYGESLSNPTSDFDEVGEEVDQSDQSAPMSDEEVLENEDTPSDDEYDEADEAYEDMQKEMQTIEEDSEKSIVAADPAPQEEVKQYKFETRDDIRHFLEDYKNWNYRDDFRTPFGKVGYWYTLKTFDIINVLEVHTIDNVSLELECEEIDKPGPIYFLARAKFSDQPSLMVGKRQLENYLMMKRDVLTGRC